MFINFCQIEELNLSEALTIDSYNEVESILNSYIIKGIKLDEYGKEEKANNIWLYANKIIYLVLYLNIVEQRIKKDFQNCSIKTLPEYTEIYKLDCIKKEFGCFSIPFNVSDLYRVFGLVEPFGFDGIDFMAIEIDNTIVCNTSKIFEVQ